MHRGNRVLLAAVLGGALVLAGELPGAWAASHAVESTQDDDGPKPRKMAHVKVEIQQEDGEVVTHPGELVEWNEDASIAFKGGGHSHVVSVKAKRVDAKKLEVTFGYARDGKAIIEGFVYDTEPKKREILRTDGDIALAVTVTPKTVKPKDKKRKEKDRVKPGEDTEDPIGGLPPK